MNYYDKILGLIPVVFAGVAGTLLAIGFGLIVAIPFAGLGVLALMGHAMFVNPPVDASTQSTPASTVTTDIPPVDTAD